MSLSLEATTLDEDRTSLEMMVAAKEQEEVSRSLQVTQSICT